MIERYTRPEMACIWTDQNRFKTWLKVELAICEAWHQLGKIDNHNIHEIRNKADFDLQRIFEIEETTKHDLIAFLSAVEEKVGSSARFIHLGCTSSDIIDTANALLLTEAGQLIITGFNKLLSSLKSLAFIHKGQMCMGRTHGIHAEPTSFGLKMAGFYAEFSRHLERFKLALEGIRVGKISGAVGTYALLEPEVEKIACKILGLEVDPISTQIIQRDRHAAYFTALALVAGGIERLCIELRHLQRTEVLEVEEGFSKGQKGSSAMPHKKNPISAENMTGLARLIRSNALVSMENMALWHERDISHSSVERVIMPDSTILIDYIFNRLSNLLTNLKVIPANMQRNLMGSYGLFFSQRVLSKLIEKGIARQEAYILVQNAAMQSWGKKEDFYGVVKDCKGITSRLSELDLQDAFDKNYYLRYEDEIFSRVFNINYQSSK